MGQVSKFLEKHFRHFNARETLAAAKGWRSHLERKGKMLLSLGGAMSTAELGVSLAEMIRAEKVHAISSTAANFEEDIFNLLAHNEYELVPNYRLHTTDTELALRDRQLNRVTDTCIPESVIGVMENALVPRWDEAARKGKPRFPCDFIFDLIESGYFDDKNQIPLEDSWVLAAHQKNVPVFTPGFEDSTLGNIYTANVMKGTISDYSGIMPGGGQFERLIRWYKEQFPMHPMGFFQIGGGISGDFAICCVPCILQDLNEHCDHWSYFAQVSDSTTSYGSYSGAPPNEKITWNKLGPDAKSYMINSDATIVAPLVFGYVLDA